MKNLLFAFSAALIIAASAQNALAQQNLYVKGTDGTIKVFATEKVESLSFTNTDIYDFSWVVTSSITDTSFKVNVNVAYCDGITSVSETPELGICYTDEDRTPTYDDNHIKMSDDLTEWTCTLEDLTPSTTYKYCVYAKLLNQTFYSDVYSVTTSEGPKQDDTINGHEYVDLGLPSGLLWATCNIGASTPYADGDHFAWGETEAKTSYSYSTYKWCDSHYAPTKYNSTDGKTTLEADDDAATANWGEGWRIPTKAEMQELKDNCTWAWQNDYNGATGYLITGTNGNSIFIPTAGYYDYTTLYSHKYGYYWSSSVHTTFDEVYYLSLSSSGIDANTFRSRCWGYSVRPVAPK